MIKSYAMVVILFCFASITGCGQEKLDKTQETVQIENSTYTRAQIHEHLRHMYKPRLNDDFILWSKFDSPYHCLLSISKNQFPAVFDNFNRVYKSVSSLASITFTECDDWHDRDKNYNVVFLYSHDFSNINEVVNIEDLVGRPVNEKEIENINSKRGKQVKYERYRMDSNNNKSIIIASIFSRFPEGSTNAWANLLYKSSYLGVSGGFQSAIIKESILHPESNRIDLSELDKLVLKFSYEISSGERVYTTKEAINLIADRVVQTLSNK
jgi:hypothetical protein